MMPARELLDSLGQLSRRLEQKRREQALCARRLLEEGHPRWQRRGNELKQEIKALEEQAHQRSQAIEDLVCALEEEVLRQMLLLRYVQQLSYQDISLVLGYSLRHIHRLHLDAMARLEARLGDGERVICQEA